LPLGAPVRRCYEAGRDGFWLHRWLLAHAVENVVVDASSIEVNRGGWVRWQPTSAWTPWFLRRFGPAGGRSKRIGIVALARKDRDRSHGFAAPGRACIHWWRAARECFGFPATGTV
jgi:hypothetical protein